MSKPTNVSVNIKQCHGNVEKMIRRFIKKTKKERIIEDYLDRRFYEKRSDKRRRLKAKKLCNARKAERERNINYNNK